MYDIDGFSVSGGFSGFDFMEAVFPVIFVIVFLIIICVAVVIVVKGISQYRANEASPLLTVDAEVVTKRESVSHHHAADDSMHHTSTSYYVTFEVESGDRMELSMGGREFGMLAEGDKGRLSFQGTRYKGFERDNAYKHTI